MIYSKSYKMTDLAICLVFENINMISINGVIFRFILFVKSYENMFDAINLCFDYLSYFIR